MQFTDTKKARMATVTDLAELATLEFCSTRDIYSLGFEILVDYEKLR